VNRIALALVTVLILALPTAAATYQSPPNSVERWTLAGSGTSPTAPFTMFRVIPQAAPPSGGVVTLAPNEIAYWTSNESALANFEMGGGGRTFTVRLQIRAGSNLEVAVGVFNATFTPCGAPQQINVGAAGTLPPLEIVDQTRAEIFTASFQPASCPVKKGETFAIAVKALGTPARIGTEDAQRINGAPVPRSSVSYAFTPPAWPTPELPTVALSIVGLGMAAFAVSRRR